MKPIDTLNLRPEHYKGTASEYIAASLFLRKGHQVYWPAVQQSCVDFVVYMDGTYKKVQVKTATWNKASGPHSYLQCRTRETNKYRPKYDILVIIGERDVWTIPIEEIDSSNLSLAGTNPDYPPSRWEIYREPL